MADRPDILAAKVQKLAAIIEDGNRQKDNSNRTVSEARQAQRAAAADVIEATGSSVAEIEEIELPSER